MLLLDHFRTNEEVRVHFLSSCFFAPLRSRGCWYGALEMPLIQKLKNVDNCLFGRPFMQERRKSPQNSFLAVSNA